MKLTPWMLTIATFGMVFFIAASYLVKQSDRPFWSLATYAPGSGFDRDPDSFAPPIRQSRPGVTNAETKQNPTPPETPDKAESTPQQTEPPYEPGSGEPVEVVTTPVPTDPVEEPVDGMFEDPPQQPAFRTEHFRGLQRSTAVFSGGRRIE